MIYLASPYTSRDSLIIKTRFLIVEQVTAQLLEQGHFIYSPIIHCHQLASKYALPTDFDFWRRYNFDMIRRCDEFWVLTIPGWQESKGVTAECDLAYTLDLPRSHVDEEGRVRPWQS